MKPRIRAWVFIVTLSLALFTSILILSQCGDDPASSNHECGSGDINLNGFAYEIADVVVFTNYFVYGKPAFTINSAEQTRATDVNCNGIQCELGDMVHMIRILVGDAVHPPQFFRTTNIANFRYEHGQVITEENLGAAFFLFDGRVDVSAANSGFEVKNDYVNGQTRVLVYTFETKEITGAILNASEKPVLINAVDYYGDPYYTGLYWQIITTSISPVPSYNTTDFISALSEPSDNAVRKFAIACDIADVVTGYGKGTINRE